MSAIIKRRELPFPRKKGAQSTTNYKKHAPKDKLRTHTQQKCARARKRLIKVRGQLKQKQ